MSEEDTAGFGEVDGETTEASPPKSEEPDLAELLERVDKLEKSTPDIDRTLRQVTSAIGLVKTFQSDLDKLKSQGSAQPPLDDVWSALSDVESVLLEALEDDTLKASLNQKRQARQQLREINKAKAEIRAEYQDNTKVDSADPAWAEATTYVIRRAREEGVDLSDPRVRAVLTRSDFASPDDGIDAVLAVFKEVKGADESVSRVASRKAAAGKGEPKSTGGAKSAQQLWDAYGAGEEVPLADVLRARKELGIA